MEDEIVKQNLEYLIKVVEDEFGHIDGPSKVALLRTVASYYENLTVSQSMQTVIYNTLNKL